MGNRKALLVGNHTCSAAPRMDRGVMSRMLQMRRPPAPHPLSTQALCYQPL